MSERAGIPKNSKSMLFLGDNELMELYAQGNEVAFNELYRRHSPKVYGYLRKRVKQESLVEETFQLVFLKLHNSKEKYNKSFPFLPWFFVICKTTLFDQLKHQRRLREENLNEWDMEYEEKDQKSKDHPIFDEINHLPHQQREALELRFQHGLEFEAIAQKLSTSPTNARQIISRALKALRKVVGSGGFRK